MEFHKNQKLEFLAKKRFSPQVFLNQLVIVTSIMNITEALVKRSDILTSYMLCSDVCLVNTIDIRHTMMTFWVPL